MHTFIIACGGTGGHLSPGIALAQELILRGHKCILIVSKKQVDKRICDAYQDVEFVKFPGVGFSKKPWKWPSFLISQIANFFRSIKLLRQNKARAVIAFGGFLSCGIVLAGKILRKICILHEANHFAGKATKLLSIFSDRIFLPDGVHLKKISAKKIKYSGFPVRREINKISKDLAKTRVGVDSNSRLLVVVGGSQGAIVLNKWVIENFEDFCKNGVNIICVTGLGKSSDCKIEEKGENGTISKVIFIPFAINMNELFSAADLVISRAGAGTIAELTKCETPSILIPYPHAADNHQEANASFFERQGGCLKIEQALINSKLKDEAIKLITNENLLTQIAYNLKQLNRFNACEIIADDIELLCQNKQTCCDLNDVF